MLNQAKMKQCREVMKNKGFLNVAIELQGEMFKLYGLMATNWKAGVLAKQLAKVHFSLEQFKTGFGYDCINKDVEKLLMKALAPPMTKANFYEVNKLEEMMKCWSLKKIQEDAAQLERIAGAAEEYIRETGQDLPKDMAEQLQDAVKQIDFTVKVAVKEC